MGKNASKPAGSNSQGDTSRVDRNKLLLNWERPRTEYELDTATKKRKRKLVDGQPVFAQAKGNSVLYLPQSVIDWFGIAPYTGSDPAEQSKPKVITVSAHTRLIYNAIDDETGRQISVDQFERSATAGKGRKPIGVKILTGKLNRYKKARGVIIPFPPFFSIWMVSQALGTMLTRAGTESSPGEKPAKFQVSSGEWYPINYEAASSTGLIAPYKYGAWKSTTLIDEENVSQSGDNVFSSNPSTSSGDPSGPNPN